MGIMSKLIPIAMSPSRLEIPIVMAMGTFINNMIRNDPNNTAATISYASFWLKDSKKDWIKRTVKKNAPIGTKEP